jgi:hypothetical protein
MTRPRIFADFQNTDGLGRPRLNCVGTLEDLARQQVRLVEGTPLLLYTDDGDDEGRPIELQLEGSATYSQPERCWVAVVNWDAVRVAPTNQSVAPVPVPGGQPTLDPRAPVR